MNGLRIHWLDSKVVASLCSRSCDGDAPRNYNLFDDLFIIYSKRTEIRPSWRLTVILRLMIVPSLIYMYTVMYAVGKEIFGDNLVNHINEINMIVEYVVRFPEPSNGKKYILIFF